MKTYANWWHIPLFFRVHQSLQHVATRFGVSQDAFAEVSRHLDTSASPASRKISTSPNGLLSAQLFLPPSTSTTRLNPFGDDTFTTHSFIIHGAYFRHFSVVPRCAEQHHQRRSSYHPHSKPDAIPASQRLGVFRIGNHLVNRHRCLGLLCLHMLPVRRCRRGIHRRSTSARGYLHGRKNVASDWRTKEGDDSSQTSRYCGVFRQSQGFRPSVPRSD